MHPNLLLKISVVAVALAVLPAKTLAQPVFEQPPVLDAATILRPEFLKGPHFSVRPGVLTYAGHNQYTIDSDFGVFEAQGNAQLVQRVGEIEAIARLNEISRSDEYIKALELAAKGPVQLARNLATDPVKTVSGIPKGLWKFVNRAGEAAKQLGDDSPPNPYDGGAGKDLIGFSKAKRDIAFQLGVDPYSSNEELQKQLNSIAWAAFGGNMTFRGALIPVGGTAANIATGVNLAQSTTAALRDNSPADLRSAGIKELDAMGVPGESATAFVNNPAWSPTEQTLFLQALGSMDGVRGRAQFVRLANSATDEVDTLFFRRTAELLAKIHRETPLEALSSAYGFPVALTQDRTLVVALEWDYASFTENASKFIDSLKTGNFGADEIKTRRVVITGVASPAAKEGLKAAGFELTEKALPGPLK